MPGSTTRTRWAGTGRAPIARTLPLNAGIKAVAEVVESADPALGPGTMVIAHGMGLGVDRDGGLADALRADAEWLVRLPESLSPREAAALGVAGYTAALAVDRLEQHGGQPGAGPIAVTGATGGRDDRGSKPGPCRRRLRRCGLTGRGVVSVALLIALIFGLLPIGQTLYRLLASRRTADQLGADPDAPFLSTDG